MAGGGRGYEPTYADTLLSSGRSNLTAIASVFREETAGMSQSDRNRLGAEIINQYLVDKTSSAPSTLIHGGHTASSLSRTVLGLLREEYTPEAGSYHIQRVAPRTGGLIQAFLNLHSNPDRAELRQRFASQLPHRFAGRSATILHDTSRTGLEGYHAFRQDLTTSVKRFHLTPALEKARTLNDLLSAFNLGAEIVSSLASPLYDPEFAEEAEASQRVDVYVNSTAEKHRPEWNSIMLQTQKRNGFDSGPLVIPRIAGIQGQHADSIDSVLYNVTPFEIEEADVYVEIVGRGFDLQSYRRAIQALEINERANKPGFVLVDTGAYMAPDGNELPRGFLELIPEELQIPYRQPDVAGLALNDALDQMLYGKRAKNEIDTDWKEVRETAMLHRRLKAAVRTIQS